MRRLGVSSPRHDRPGQDRRGSGPEADAARADGSIELGDIIVDRGRKVEATTTSSPSSKQKIGDAVPVRILRDGKEQTVDVTLSDPAPPR